MVLVIRFIVGLRERVRTDAVDVDGGDWVKERAHGLLASYG